MDKIETKHRRKLNEDQAQVLELLYKFRFGSNDLFAQYFGKKDRSFVFKRLKILLDQGLIGKRFDSSYRIQGKPAAYYLLPAGARRLPEYRGAEDTDEINIKGIYKDKIVSEQFVARCLDVFTLYNRFTSVYDDALVFLTKSDLASRDNFPKQPPDVHLRFELDEDDKEFFLLIHYSHDQFFAAIRRLQHYIKHAGSGDWAKAELDFPAIVMVFESQTDQKRFHKKATRIMHESPGDILLYTATLGDLKAITDPGQEILCSFDDPDEMFSFLDA